MLEELHIGYVAFSPLANGFLSAKYGKDSKFEVETPIPGTRKSDRLKENAGAADIKLTAKEVETLDKQLDAIEMSDVFGGTACKCR